MYHLHISVRRRAIFHERLVLSINESVFMGLCISEDTVSRRVAVTKADNKLLNAGVLLA